MKMWWGMTNRLFAEGSKALRLCCNKAGIPVTKRQASKFKRGKGLAFKYLHEISIIKNGHDT